MSWSPALISPVTSLVEPAYQMGVDACKMLLERAASGEGGPPRCHKYAPRLAVRISCGAPPEMRDVPLRAAHSLLFGAVAHPEQA
jgi:DNA-binding LacI/PurR family transcriptional regulator